MYYYSPFRNAYSKPREGCPFCDQDNLASQTIRRGETHIENEHYTWLFNKYPKFEGHTLVVPKRHVTKIGEESPAEVAAREEMIALAAQTLRALYPGAGVEIFLQTGEGSESSIPHLHWHVVPALPDDPIRGFDKLGQFFTPQEGTERVIVFPVPIRLAGIELAQALGDVLAQERNVE